MIQKNSKLIILLLSFIIIFSRFSYLFPLHYDIHTDQLIINNPRILCGHANISFSSQIPPLSIPPVPFYGHFSSCETSHGSTIINGRFYNIPNNDTNPKNYYLYLLHPNNSMRRDLSWIFTKGLRFKQDSDGVIHDTILDLTFEGKSDFPLRGVDGGWVKVYHIQNSVVTTAGPAQIL